MEKKSNKIEKQHCQVCNIDIQSLDFASHILGKRHLKKVELANFKQVLIDKSIFVRFIPAKLSNHDTVVNFFGKFGAIARCKVEPNFAIIEFKEK